MVYYVVRIALHIICFCVSYYALGALDFNKLLKQGRVVQAQLLMIILAMALGYLMAQFLLSLTTNLYI